MRELPTDTSRIDVIHDLRTQLVVIAAACDDVASSTLTSGQVDDVARIRRAAETMASRVDDALFGAEPPQTRVPQTVDVSDAVTMLTGQLRPLARMRGCSLVAEVTPGGFVLGQQSEIVSAVQNLIDNAIRHTPAGRAVRCFVTERRGVVRVEVRDEGPGFPKGQRDRLLRRHERGSEGGAGLGLAIAERCARRHGGSLTIEDAPGGGASVTMAFPASRIKPRSRRPAGRRRGVGTGWIQGVSSSFRSASASSSDVDFVDARSS